jgi:hypothetical protein
MRVSMLDSGDRREFENWRDCCTNANREGVRHATDRTISDAGSSPEWFIRRDRSLTSATNQTEPSRTAADSSRRW